MPLLPIALVLASVSPQAPGLPAEFAKLVPEDAAVLVVLRSPDELARELESFRARLAPDAPAVTGASALALVASDLELPGDVAALDTSQPLGVALRISRAGTVPTFVLAPRDPDAWRQALAGAPETLSVATAGRWVGCTAGPAPAAASAPSRLVADWPAELAAVRVDAARLTAAFQVEIDAMLGQFEQMIEAGAFENAEAPFDMTEVLELYLQFAQDLVASADVVELMSDARDGEYVLDAALVNKPGSPLAKHASTEPVDYAALARMVRADAMLQSIQCYSQAWEAEATGAMWSGMIESLEASGELPPALVAALRTYFEHGLGLVPRYGPRIAGSGDLDGRGLRIAAGFEPPDAAALVEAIAGLVEEPAFAEVGLVAVAEPPAKAAGADARTWMIGLDAPRLVAALPEGALDDVAEPAVGIQKLVRRLLGGDTTRCTIVRAGPKVVVAGGGDEAWRTAATKQMLAGGEPSPGLARVAAELAGANPAWGMHADVARLLAGFGELLGDTGIAELDDDETLATMRSLGGRPLPASMYWTVTERRWRLGLRADAEGVRAMAARVHELVEVADRRHAAESDLTEIMWALEFYRDERGELPARLDALTELDEDGEPYLDLLPTDPWGRKYLYERSAEGATYVVRTLGADGQPGGSGESADLSSEDLPQPEGFDEEYEDDEEMGGEEMGGEEMGDEEY